MNAELLKSGIQSLGGTITEQQIDQLAAYAAQLREWNQKINLTAIVDPDGIAVKHFLDSILPLFYVPFPKEARLADVGTGAGFPGIPLKIMRPDLNVTLLDSLQKRVDFLTAVCEQLAITEICAVHGRAEELGKNQEYREQFDIVTSRAVANLTGLGEYCLPLTKVGGIFLALKAENVEEELEAARPMLGSLGGKVEEVIAAPLPKSDMVRKLIVIRKRKPTPPNFPRRANRIKK